MSVDDVETREEAPRSVPVPQGSHTEQECGLQTLGRYKILRTLDRGAMGTVLQAYDPELDRAVAIKILHQELDPLHAVRLRREAQALARLSHPNVVQVYEVGEVNGQTFVVMELIKGKTLRQWMDRTPRPAWKECIEVYLQVGAGLAAAHEQGLVHRDFKPGNAIVDAQGRVRVLDFGLARKCHDNEIDEDTGVQRARSESEEDLVPLMVSLTHAGTILGTPAYMPPEQMQGKEADARSDQFSFCVALFEAIYGRRPYEGSSITGLMLSMESKKIFPTPKGCKAPARLRPMLVRGLALQPEYRWPSMEALLAELRRLVVPWRPWHALVVATALTAIGVGVGRQAEVATRCTDGSEQLEGIWDDARRQQVEAAILDTALPYAPEAWTHTSKQLDAYAEDWKRTHTEVCEASASASASASGSQLEPVLARMHCLDERKTALHAAVKVLAGADAQVVRKATQVVSKLPGLDRCNDVEALLAEIPLPEDPKVAEEVDTLRGRLAELEAELEAGRYRPALAGIESLQQEAWVLAYEPVVAEVELLRGRLLEADGQYDQAELALTEAYDLGLVHGHDQVVLEAAASLAFVVGDRQARSAEGLVWGRTALHLAQREGEATDVADAFSSLAAVFSSQGQYAEAEQHVRRALELRHAELGGNDPLVATSRDELGALLLRQGKYADAELQLRQALQIEQRALGADHPALADSGTHLGDVLYRQGRYDKAETELLRALEIREQALGVEHPLVAVTVNSLGRVLDKQGRFDEAERHYDRALKMLERSLGDEHPDMARITHSLGMLLRGQKKYEEAEQQIRRALQIRERTLGPEHPDVAESIHGLGVVLYGQKKYAEAEQQMRRAMEIRVDALGAEHPDVAKSHYGLGLVLHSRGRYSDAERELRRALEIRERSLGEGHLDLANSANTLGATLYPQGKYEEAKRYYQQALRIWKRTLGKEHPNIAMSMGNLGNVLLSQGEYEDARLHYEQALDIFEKTRGG